MPDVPAAATGVTASYLFWKWLQKPTWSLTAFVGMGLGAAILSKTTLLIFFAIWPLAACLVIFTRRCSPPGITWRRQGIMFAAVFVAAIYVLNLGYGFIGSFERLGEFRFQSRLLKGDVGDQKQSSENRFDNTLMSSVPVPVPRDYLQGIDRQLADFDQGGRSYLRGKWQQGGWWYYHLYALAIKVPLGTLIILTLAVIVSLTSRRYLATRNDEFCLIVPAVVVIGLVSSHTGFSNHMRYTIPAMPFLFIWISKVGRAVEFRHWSVAGIVSCAILWTSVSSLWHFPHSLSYFNEVAGGPRNGHNHLLDSNIAWGQDLLHLKGWLDDHPEAGSTRIASFGWNDPRLAGIEFRLPPVGPRENGGSSGNGNVSELGPQPGWYAIDVNYLHGTHWPAADGTGRWAEIAPDGPNFEYFRRLQPIDSVGYSIYIYHVTLDEANRVRGELGMSKFDE